MANVNKTKGVIGILTGGGDVPGLNPAIRAVTIRAIREGYQVIGLRRGWAGIIDIVRDKKADNSNNYQILTEEIVNRMGRTGGTFLHTLAHPPEPRGRRTTCPTHLQDTYTDEINDLTPEVLKNLDFLGIDYLIPIGGDDTLELRRASVPGRASRSSPSPRPWTTTCRAPTTASASAPASPAPSQMTNSLRTSAGSHERFLVLEVFGRYAGFTAMLPTMAGAANRCVIPEYKFDIERLTELLVDDRSQQPEPATPSCWSRKGAMFEGGEMVFADQTTDAYGHKKLGGIGDLVSARAQGAARRSYNNGKPINIINQRLGYLVRGGDPDAIDSIVPMAYGNLALDLILEGMHGRLVVLKNGRYDNVPIDVVTSTKKLVNVEQALQHRAPAPPLQELRDEAAVHHDQRVTAAEVPPGGKPAVSSAGPPSLTDPATTSPWPGRCCPPAPRAESPRPATG